MKHAEPVNLTNNRYTVGFLLNFIQAVIEIDWHNVKTESATLVLAYVRCSLSFHANVTFNCRTEIPVSKLLRVNKLCK